MSTRILIEMVVVPAISNLEQVIRSNVNGDVEVLHVDPDPGSQSVLLRLDVRDRDYLRGNDERKRHALEAAVCDALLSATRSLGSVAHCWALNLDASDAYNV